MLNQTSSHRKLVCVISLFLNGYFSAAALVSGTQENTINITDSMNY